MGVKLFAWGFNLNSLAYGLSVDFSNGNEPIEELGDKPELIGTDLGFKTFDDGVELGEF